MGLIEHTKTYTGNDLETIFFRPMLTGPNDDLVNIYTRVDFMKYYMGIDLYSYREDTIYADWYDEMPSYPDPGSIMMRPEENRIIIKLQ